MGHNPAPAAVSRLRVYTYTAMDACGGERRSSIEAESEADAANKLKNQGLFPIRIFHTPRRDRDLFEVEPCGPNLFARSSRAVFSTVRAFIGTDHDEPEDELGEDLTFDPAMMGMVCLSLVMVIGRQNMGISYMDLTLALFIVGCFCWWRAYIIKERLNYDKSKESTDD